MYSSSSKASFGRVSSAVLALLCASSQVLAGPIEGVSIPNRYPYASTNAIFLYSTENGGIATPPSEYETVPIQAIDGKIVFTLDPPTRVCPCADSKKYYGAKNYTGFYVGGTNEAPTLELYTSSPLPQYVYVDTDLSLRYTAPGEPIPAGANGTSISFFDPEPLGDGLPSGSVSNVAGYVTQLNGTKTYYNGLQFCAPPGSPPRTEDGVGPLKISATVVDPNGINGVRVDPHCISNELFNSINYPQAGPYYIVFEAPAKPLVSEYKAPLLPL